MMVPRAFRYSSSPPNNTFDEKTGHRNVPRNASPKADRLSALIPSPPARTTTEPVRVPSRPVAVPTPERTQSAGPQSIPTMRCKATTGGRRRTAAHDPDALPPAVAALLAVTEIPRPKKNQFRRRSSNPRKISIDELVKEWKNDDSLKSSYGSSPALSVLLENTDDMEEQNSTPKGSLSEGSYMHTRTTSAESVPSLEADDRSILSSGSLSTPGSLRSRRSCPNLKKDKPRSLPATEECGSDHPLVERASEDDDPDDSLMLSPSNTSRVPTPKPKSSFKSNITTSLQALKNAAITSLSSFSFSNASAPSQRPNSPTLSDDMLWSHPYLFPRFSSEIRPAISGTPTKAQRRYLNPMPLTFEEQEAPYQQALHAPFLAEQIKGAPTIPMQTYSRGRRRGNAKRSGVDPSSEAGRALSGPPGVRQREPRENSDFLRVVVLEMNMRREGKLEMGRAKIWLPPRQVGAVAESTSKVPKRWVGESAY